MDFLNFKMISIHPLHSSLIVEHITVCVFFFFCRERLNPINEQKYKSMNNTPKNFLYFLPFINFNKYYNTLTHAKKKLFLKKHHFNNYIKYTFKFPIFHKHYFLINQQHCSWHDIIYVDNHFNIM